MDTRADNHDRVSVWDAGMTDACINRSRQKIKDAFISLMEKEDPARITVKQLCRRADVNRSTFYARSRHILCN